MKRTLFLVVLLAMSLMTFAQEITVRFTGQLNGTAYQRLDSVVVTNATRDWTETVAYPDTIIVLGSTVNISENEAFVAGLGQNVPNPFDCQTRVRLTVSQQENVYMQLLDASGKLYADYNGTMDAGTHEFEISAANPQTYVLNAIAGSKSYSIRMVNVGSGCNNYIKYQGLVGGLEAKLTTTNEFHAGDQMQYVGHATIAGEPMASEAVSQAQSASQNITLHFSYVARPTVLTLLATEVTLNSATLNGYITENADVVTACGFQLGTSENDLSVTMPVSTTGATFSMYIPSLDANTTYYFRAYATDAIGTVYGETRGFTTASVVEPTVSTLAVTAVTYTTATLGGSIVANGGSSVTECGFRYSTSSMFGSFETVTCSAVTNSFSYNLEGLNAGTTYYVKAYATNAIGTAFGEVQNFTTESYLAPAVTTLAASGITINGATLNGMVNSDGGAEITGRGFYWGTSADNLATQVALGIGTGVITTTINNLADNTTYFYRAYASNTTGTAYGEIKSFTTVEILRPSVTTMPATNSTRNSLTLNASISSDGGAAVTERGFYWGTAENDLPNYVASSQTTADFAATVSELSVNTVYYYSAAATNIKGTSLGEVLSARTNPLTAPAVTTNAAIVRYTSVTLNATITDDGGTTVTACGFYWGTSADNLVNNATATGTGSSFSADITGLAASTTYYYCAYATNSTSTGIGSVMSFTTPCACGGSYKVTDYDGNQYGTVLIGEQCWMAQNLKTTHYADGTSISLGSTTSTTTAYRYNPNNSSDFSTYGYLYNWPAAMHGASSSSTNPSNVQGICPNGWHLPSDAEWTQLTDYVSSQSEYQCGGTTTNIAKALASIIGWSSSSNTCAVGNTPSGNNSTGFSALPAGDYSGSYNGFGGDANFWSATESSSSFAYYRYLNYDDALVDRYGDVKNYGFSVRCVRD